MLNASDKALLVAVNASQKEGNINMLNASTLKEMSEQVE